MTIKINRFALLSLCIVLFFELNGCSIFIRKPKGGTNTAQNAEYHNGILTHGKQGYWLLIRGYHSTDHLVAGATLSEYSHAAILDLSTNEIIESTSEGVHPLSLEEFISKSHKITIIKPYGYSASRADSAVRIARNYIGKPYDFLGTVGLNSKEKYYCSELAVHCYPNLIDSLKIPTVIEPRDLLKMGESVYSSEKRMGN